MKIKYKPQIDQNKTEIGMKVALSSTADPCYSFCLPIACFLWKNIMGYTPIVFLVDKQKWDESKHGSYIINRLKEMEIDYFYINKIEGVSAATVSKVSRLYSFAMCNKDDYMITSDADMFPFSKEIFKNIDKSKDFYLITYPYNNSDRYSMCYIGGYCRSWAEVMSVKDIWGIKDRICEVNRLLGKDMVEGLGIPHTDSCAFYYDELSFSKKLRLWTGFPDKVKITKQKSENRILLVWNRNDSLDNKTDLHLMHDGYKGEAWIGLQLVLSNILGDVVCKWVTNYRNEFVKKI